MNEEIKRCRIIVASTNYQVLVIKEFGEFKYYIVDSFYPKTINNPYNEVMKGVEITSVLGLMGSMSSVTDNWVDEKKVGLPVEDFKFGHDEWVWLIKIEQNKKI